MSKAHEDTFEEYDMGKNNKANDDGPGIPVSRSSRCVGKFCLGLSNINATMEGYAEFFSRNVFLDILFNALPRGVGQVTFMNNPATGLVTWLALLTTYPGRALFGLYGMIVAHLVVLFLGFDRSLIRTGFYGYNALQCSMALCAFLVFPPVTAWTWFMLFCYVTLVAAFSVILQVAITSMIFHEKKQHPLTWCFSIVTLMSVLMAQKYNRFPLDPSFVPDIKFTAAVEANGQNITSSDWRWASIINPEPLKFTDIIIAGLRGVSQVYLNNSSVAGVFLLLSMCFCSRVSAVMSFVGSVVGVGTAQFMGVAQDQIMEGIWGYCGALAGVAIGGVFYTFSFKSFCFAIFAAVVATFANAALASFLSVYGIPTMSFGFIFTNTIFTMIGPYANELRMVPLGSITTAEEHFFRRKQTSEQ